MPRMSRRLGERGVVSKVDATGTSEIGEEEIARFREDGFLLMERLIDPALAAAAAARYEPLFAGEFETGLQPDEWNWRAGRDSPELTRQICNAWKADRTIARIVLAEWVGRACAWLMGWPGARLYQDNVLWKPPGARPLGFHQDDSYVDWIEPPSMVTCWIALDDTTAEGGTMGLVHGSHRWPVAPPIARFHAPEDPHREMRAAAASLAVAPEIVPVVVPVGGGSFHAGRTWHGSGINRAAAPRRSLVAHCLSCDARFNDRPPGPVYGRYRRFGDDTMDESFFPILWTADGRRSAFLDGYLAEDRGERS